MGVFEYLFGLENRTERSMARTSLEDADLVYAETSMSDTRLETAKRLQERGYSVTSISADQVERNDGEVTVKGKDPSVLEDTTVFYREETYCPPEGREEERELIEEIESAAGNFVNSLTDVRTAADKRYDHLNLRRHGVDTPDQFNSVSDAKRHVENGGQIIAKDRRGKGGSGFELFDEEIDNLEDGKIYQEAIDTTSNRFEERRGFMVGQRATAIQAREDDRDEITAQNIQTGAEYYDPDSISASELDSLERASMAAGGDITAVDYIKDVETGDITVLETNKTPGTGINESAEEDIFDHMADYLESEITGEEFRSDNPGTIQDRLEPEMMESSVETVLAADTDHPETPQPV